MWGLLLVPFLALGAEVNLTCTEPTQNEDGTPLTDLAGIRFYESSTPGGPYTQIGDEVACSLTVQRDPGTYYYVATAYNTSGVESQYSNEATKTVTASPPAPPTNLTADGNTVAYAIQQFEDGLTVYPVALVNETTDCDPNIRVYTGNFPGGLSLIPRSAVTFAGNANAYTVYAQCTGS